MDVVTSAGWWSSVDVVTSALEGASAVEEIAAAVGWADVVDGAATAVVAEGAEDALFESSGQQPPDPSESVQHWSEDGQ